MYLSYEQQEAIRKEEEKARIAEEHIKAQEHKIMILNGNYENLSFNDISDNQSKYMNRRLHTIYLDNGIIKEIKFVHGGYSLPGPYWAIITETDKIPYNTVPTETDEVDKKQYYIERLEPTGVVSNNSNSDVQPSLNLEVSKSTSDNEKLCVICIVNQKNTVLLPCKHLCVCKDCADRVSACPMCTIKIDDRMKVFLGGSKEIIYQNKYLKYKEKYLNLKNKLN